MNYYQYSVSLFLALNATVGANFGEGLDPIFLDDLVCNGSETRLIDCPHFGIGNHNCQHFEDAGVICTCEYTISYILYSTG